MNIWCFFLDKKVLTRIVVICIIASRNMTTILVIMTKEVVIMTKEIVRGN